LGILCQEKSGNPALADRNDGEEKQNNFLATTDDIASVLSNYDVSLVLLLSLFK
jgi:hypothetical protein